MRQTWTLFAFRLINAVPIRRRRIMAEGLDAFGVYVIERADAEAFSSLAARFDCVQCLRPILLAVIPQHPGRELAQFLEMWVLTEFRAPKDRENGFGLCFPFHLDPVDLHGRESFFCLLCGCLADDNGDPLIL